MAVSCYLQPRAMNGIKTLPSVTKSWLAERGSVQTKYQSSCRPRTDVN